MAVKVAMHPDKERFLRMDKTGSNVVQLESF